MWVEDFCKKVQILSFFPLVFFLYIIFSCYYCCIDLKRNSEHLGLCPVTSNDVCILKCFDLVPLFGPSSLKALKVHPLDKDSCIIVIFVSDRTKNWIYVYFLILICVCNVQIKIGNFKTYFFYERLSILKRPIETIVTCSHYQYKSARRIQDLWYVKAYASTNLPQFILKLF